ncbi:proline--tRNA ligase [Patulibacter minatonensis]|uniref:proline--tRNA ligase n=1 Tax=Patulibacter minatonensis TaxID=298163 RepID=UPI00047D72BD|nr:proline--tRNA ligase [Patulibacter minatonensis]
MPKPPVLTPQATDFPKWYQDVVSKAELADNGPVRGTMVIRPWAYGIWEQLQGQVDRRIKGAGAQNAYFPLLIPASYLQKEAEHVEGFAPELAVVTQGGGKELEEPAVIRPTSETIINSYFAKWINSYKDLPLRINNWSNVVRWELRPRLFLRTTEFLWQEGHTAHATADEAQGYAVGILEDVYRQVIVDVMGIPVIPGLKTDKERFAGAIRSWTVEGMMGDGKALQMGTSHELAQNFAKAFDIRFQDQNGEMQHPWQTSWGVSTRLLGAAIMVHGDDHGIRLSPRLAPTQVVVMQLAEDEPVAEAARATVQELLARGVRVELDDRVDRGFGRRATDWELKGAPVRIEIGKRDIEGGVATIADRVDRSKGPVPLTELVARTIEVLDGQHQRLYDEALTRRTERTVDVATVDEALEAAGSGFARIPWAILGVEGEEALAKQGVTVRCLVAADGGLPEPGADDLVAVVARAY